MFIAMLFLMVTSHGTSILYALTQQLQIANKGYFIMENRLKKIPQFNSFLNHLYKFTKCDLPYIILFNNASSQ